MLDGSGDTLTAWLRKQGATEHQAKDIADAARRVLAGTSAAQQEAGRVRVETHALDALRERLELREAAGTISTMQAEMLATTWVAALAPEKALDATREILGTRLAELEGRPDRSHAQEAERRRLRDRRDALRGPQAVPKPPAPPGAAPPGGGAEHDRGARDGNNG